MFAFDLAEPFDGTNTARAVHEKQKFDMIRVEFAQVKSTSHVIFLVTLFFKIVTQMVVIKPACFMLFTISNKNVCF